MTAASPSINSPSKRIGIDLGGTKIEGILLDQTGAEVERTRVPTPQGDYLATVQAIADLVKRLDALAAEMDGIEVPTVGVAIPGAASLATGLIKNANSVCLIGKPLDHDLAEAIGRTVRLANDANCFSVSEAVDGAAAEALRANQQNGPAVVFGVILGTGVGGGISIGGHPLTGVNAIAGEWGHNPLPWPEDSERPGPPCYCGKHGCIETFLSGPGMENDHHAATCARLVSPEIVARAAQGDAACEATLQRYEQRLARALASVINVLDPDVIVLGGGLSNIARLYERIPKLWGDWVFSDKVDTQLVQNRHGDSSGVRGAAWLWA
ncbi:ROK family protein [Magnetovibrio sp.]|uniref:ROK family protein n=1 Tax=Magnetovibrio sp. TaxID=2024836 RepID=UPI002F93E736